MVTGDEYANILYTDYGDDIIYGNGGDDILASGAGNDMVYGGDGDDTVIQNGSGTQSYDGGLGTDTFVIELENFPLPDDFILGVDLPENYSGPENDRSHPE